ncbi:MULTISPECIES: hybrid sensor histidine kinase/response regulator [unclassified Imperialibacter]|uniref:hybrid sensor histidine kinase/response regulator n=1 Tax=unclassified Imperialibacter TaxID=2629706 RepID=UPI001255B3E3|nr:MULTISPECIES: hybrid sensor histidine kinase/response regulator [unclassified Imperialibacter]CAD5270219.1 putative Two-component response regulator [Imperialibacter sp. 89]CAD5298078.1 putative Two-component response regulator [Imperialibacter sp. 75]VVT34279.1 putative Two-component response regulator [Imperialibacter sp. EC-SDR9]
MQEKKYSILYVDDESNNLIVFRNAFFRNFKVITSNSAEEALDILKTEVVQVIISDQRMPGMSGIDFLSKANQISPDSIKMILTAYSDIDVILKAVNEVGIYQFILKPWDSNHLLLTLNNAIQKYELSTQNKALIDDLGKAKANLEQKVIERTQELATKNKELSTLNEVKDKFFSIISHDLKLPIASLNILLEIMLSFKHQLDEQKVHDLGEKAKEYLQHVTQLLDNLLHWSLSQTGDIKISNKKTDLVKVAKGQVDLFDFLASQKDIRIIMETDGHPLWSMVDENMVSLVLRNLISNAIKYSHEKGEIHLSFSKEKDIVIISIVDDGVGIPQELIDKLKGNMWSEPRRGTMNEKGAGLGLRLGKEFIEKMHGQLIIDSSVNKGTKVKVYLPLYEVVTQKEIA